MRRAISAALTPSLATAFLAAAAPGAAQTPLCVWNGAALTCPATPVPRPVIGGSADRFDPLIQLQDSRQQGIARAEARASTDRVVAAQRLARAEALALVRERAGALVAAKDCAGAENVARRGGAPDVLANVQTACAGRR